MSVFRNVFLAVLSLALLASVASSVTAHAATNNEVIDVDSAQTDYTVAVGTTVWTATHNKLARNNFLKIEVQPAKQDVVGVSLIADYVPPALLTALNLQPDQRLFSMIFHAEKLGNIDLVIKVMAPVLGANPHLEAVSTKTIHLIVK